MLRTVIFEYIEGFYNRRRPYSTLGMRSLAEYESDHAAGLTESGDDNQRWTARAGAREKLCTTFGCAQLRRQHQPDSTKPGEAQDGSRVARELRSGMNLSSADLARALIATEFVFASDYYGAGWDWENVTGLSDEDTIKRLREVQRKLIGVARLP